MVWRESEARGYHVFTTPKGYHLVVGFSRGRPPTLQVYKGGDPLDFAFIEVHRSEFPGRVSTRSGSSREVHKDLVRTAIEAINEARQPHYFKPTKTHERIKAVLDAAHELLHQELRR